MEISVSNEILAQYSFSQETVQIERVGSGHINGTFLLSPKGESRKYILQNINTNVFKHPEAIANNIKIVADYLKSHYPDYLFITPIPTQSGHEMAESKGSYWRLIPYIGSSIALDTLNDPKQAYEAAKQFGKLSRLLDGCDPSQLSATIPGFHDLELRYTQFTEALEHTTLDLKQNAAHSIDKGIHFKFILDFFKSYQHSAGFPDRIMHHDTKISNMLFDEHNYTGVCVIDLDTLMPGKFISDLGDMMRTYLCAFSENETDLSKITIREDYFEAMIKGYLSEMGHTLTDTEKELILFSGKYIIYMQAIRFLADYLNGSVYYPIAYPQQNLDRANNQFKLLSELFANEKILQDIISECLN